MYRFNTFTKKILLRYFYGIFATFMLEYVSREQRSQAENLARSALIGSNVLWGSTSKVSNHRSSDSVRIGNCCSIHGHLLTYAHGGCIEIGDYCFIGQGTRIWSAQSITIGKNVLISHNVDIHDNDSHPKQADVRHKDFVHIFHHGLPKNNEFDRSEAPVIIEDDVWIGFDAAIMHGVRIGKGAIIGAKTVITKDVLAYSIVVGNPQRIIGTSS